VKSKSKALWFAKLAVGLSLIAWLLLRADLTELGAILREVHLGWLFLGLTLPFLAILLSSMKWWVLLRAKGAHVPLVTLFNLYMIGTFFNSFFPSMVGGDVVRVYQLARYGVDSGIAVASTFVERLTGLFALVAMVPLVLLVGEVGNLAEGVWGFEAIAISGLMVLSVLLFVGQLDALPIIANPPGGLLGKVISVFERARLQVRSYRGHPQALARSFGLSLLFYSLSGVTLWTVTMAVGGGIELWKLVLVAPLVLAFGLIPISVNGLGVLEAGYTWALVRLGMSPAEAISVALLIRGRLLLHAMIGGLIFLAYRRRSEQPPAAAGGPV
jgi:hypothetical protein